MRSIAKVSGIVACVALLGPARAGSAQPLAASPASDVAIATAQRALPALVGLVTAANYQALGFQSLEELKVVTLGAPIQVRLVRLDELAQYAPAKDPATLLHASPRVMLPLLVQGQVRSAMMVFATGRGDEVTLGGVGGATLVRALETIRRQSMAQTQLPASAYLAIDVPALNLHLLGFQQGAVLMVIPLANDASRGLQAGVPVAARALFTRLVPETRGDFSKPR